ncbi:MAG: V4R domain-containing protein [Candidatus Micrarchaeaceae archaeon]
MSRKMVFEDGLVTFYGEGVLIFPAPSIIKYTAMINDEPEYTKSLYQTAKESVLEYKQNLLKECGSNDHKKFIIDTIKLYGLGKIGYEIDSAEPTGMIMLENSPFASNDSGKANNPIDHILRGLIVGMVSAIFDREFDMIEIECRASGGNNCKFLLDSSDELIKKFPLLCANQI